jgi:hypothetical protein
MVVILKPLDKMGFRGYGIDTEGRVWSRLDTHSGITKGWFNLETRFRNGAVWVKLRTRLDDPEVRVAALLLEAVFGKLPERIKGAKIRYGAGGPRDCSLSNLSFGTHRTVLLSGARYASTVPPGFKSTKV